jgi:hypothetical protein
MAVTITRSVWIDDDGTGTTGTVINQALHTTLYNEIDTALAQLAPLTALGAWTAIPFNAANFTSDSGTWVVAAGNQTMLAYMVVGKLLLLSFALTGTTVTGAPVFLRIKLPTGFTASGTIYAPNPFWYQAGAAWALGVNNSATGTVLGLLRDPLGTAWTAGSAVSVQGTGIVVLL